MSTRKPNPPSDGPTGWGMATCAYGHNGGSACGKRAAVHVLFDRSDMSNGLICEPCLRQYEKKYGYDDMHDFGGVCLIPGTDWVDSTETHTGTCVLPLDDAEDEATQILDLAGKVTA